MSRRLTLLPPMSPEERETAVFRDLSAVKARIRAELGVRLSEDPMIGEALRTAHEAIERAWGERDALILLVSVLSDFGQPQVPQDSPGHVHSTAEETRDAPYSVGGPEPEPPPARPA